MRRCSQRFCWGWSGNTFDHLYEQFRIKDEVQIEQNRNDMCKPWNITDRWMVLKDRFDDGIAYPLFADTTISAADALNMMISVLVKKRVFQAQYEEWHAIPRGNHTLTNAWVWWGMKARLKRKLGAVAGEMSRSQYYGGNAADQIQHQPAGDAQYKALIEVFVRGHLSTQKTISNQQTQIQRQVMAMNQRQQQLVMSAAQQWQQRKQQTPWQHQNNTRDKNKGRKSRGNTSINRNRGGNQPTWGTNTPSRFSRENLPENFRSNKTAKYCWTHSHKTRHNSSECTAQFVGHKTNATNHVNRGGNPKNSERSITPSTLGVTGVDICARGQIQQ